MKKIIETSYGNQTWEIKLDFTCLEDIPFEVCKNDSEAFVIVLNSEIFVCQQYSDSKEEFLKSVSLELNKLIIVGTQKGYNSPAIYSKIDYEIKPKN